MSHRFGPPLITGAHIHGNSGLGVLAELVPSTGEHGPGIASTWLGPAEAGKEVRVLITQWPEVGSLFVWEDTSFEYDGPGGTAYAQLYVEGQPVDTPQTVTVAIGAQVSSNASAAYTIRNDVLCDESVAYVIRTSLSTAASCAYAIENDGQVSSSVTAAYMVREVVSGDAANTYAIKAQAQADALVSYVIRSGITFMTGNAALDLVLQRIGRWGEAALRATALSEMQLVQQEYEQGPNLPWFLEQTKTASVGAGASDVALPAGFIRFDDDGGAVYFDINTTRYFPEIVLLQHLREQAPAAADIPRAVAPGDKLYLFPGTSTAITLNICACYSDSLPVDAASTNLWLMHAPYVLIAKTAFRMAQAHLQDFELASSIAQQVQEAEQRLANFTVARRYSRVDLVKGD